MRTSSIRNAFAPLLFSYIAMVLAILLSCTIKDDNGNLIPVGPGNLPIDTTGIVTPTVKPAIFTEVDSQYIGIGDTATIQVTIFKDSSLQSGAILSNALVTATTTKGSLLQDSLKTASNGKVSFKFTDTVEGRVEIAFRCGTASLVLRLDVTNAPDKIQKRIQAIPQRAVLKADGKDSTIIEVTVLNPDHNPLSGQSIQFVATSGAISALNSSGEKPGIAITDADGIARAKLRSANMNDTSFITAFFVSDRTLSDETRVVFQGVTIVMAVDSSNIRPNATTGVTAQLLNASGEPIPYSPIFFDTTANLSIVSRDSVTDYNGHANIVIRGKANGSGSLTARAAGATTTSKINVTDLVLTVSLDAAKLQAREDRTTQLHVEFRGSSSLPLANKTVTVVRHYLTREGADTTDTLAPATTGSDGKTTIIIRALSYECAMRLDVRAQNGIDVASAETSIEFITSRQMTIQALPSIIPADRSSQSAITVFVKNEDNNPMIGENVLFRTDVGMITGSAETDENGKAVAYLTSDLRNAIAHVFATLESQPEKKQQVSVEFSGVTLTASANPSSIKSSGTDTSLVTCALSDAMKNPISQEPVNFYVKHPSTVIIRTDSVTSNRGEARCWITGTGSGQDTITVEAAGALATVIIYYSPNVLSIDTAPPSGIVNTYLANGTDSTYVTITLRNGSGAAIANEPLQINVTLGEIPGAPADFFAITDTTANNGEVSFYMRNPDFANTATICAKSFSASEVTSGCATVYYRADAVDHIALSGSPEVISTNGDRSKITAIAYDAQGNRVKDATITFNMISGPGGGEYLDPPLALTGSDGSATTYLFSGSTPSNHKDIWVVAGVFSHVRSDTAKFTIAGPPHYITIRSNIFEGTNPKDGTFILPAAAIVTDINGNPVADGTEVTFSLKISGFRVRYPIVRQWDHYYSIAVIDTAAVILPFEDFNDNFRLDPGEDRNFDGAAGRGEDLNGDGVFNPGPGFYDINGDGKRQYKYDIDSFMVYGAHYLPDPAEPIDLTSVETDSAGKITIGRWVDWNGNGRCDLTEPLRVPGMTDSAYEAQPGFNPATGLFPDIDWNQNGVADPNTAVSITRTVQTVGGKAVNQILYGQSDAWKIEVMIWAESQGVVTLTPEQIVLPAIK